MSNVKVAVRVRPLSSRERSGGQTCCTVFVEDHHTVAVTNLKVLPKAAGDSRARVRRFSADHCFDSSRPEDKDYATQNMIYDVIGRDVLDALSNGHSACIMAYGQSASGKTHTMLGSAEELGLIPRLCNAIVSKTYKDDSEDDSIEIKLSYLEIYNEKVHDLLTPDEQFEDGEGDTKSLKLREHPRKGTYVQNLSGVPVRGRSALAALVARGASRRRTAATARNARSSRSHALVVLARGACALHLADLAGSERVGGGGNGRQKEGASINRSLVALGNVISALATQGGKHRYVPYRGSALTWLLKDSLSGGAFTYMVATVSPASSSYSETLNTLRWAARARLIRPVAKGVGSRCAEPRATQELKALREEVESLSCALRAAAEEIKLLKSNYIHGSNNNERIVNEIDRSVNRTIDMAYNQSVVGNIDIQDKAEHFEDDTDNLKDATESVESSVGSDQTLSEKNFDNELEVKSQEDHLFGPRLRRTGSAYDLKPLVPSKSRINIHRSHEVLTTLGEEHAEKSKRIKSLSKTNSDDSVVSNISNSTLDIDASITSTADSKENSQNTVIPTKPVIIYQPDNKRAEIVASVTQRLYTKLKNKEQMSEVKLDSLAEKKIAEPLSELKICSNARQRLLDISQRALRARRKIGIPVQTQTRSLVTRLKEIAIGVQSDLQPFFIPGRDPEKLYIHALIQTDVLARRCKDASSGPSCGSVFIQDKSTNTERGNDNAVMVVTRSCGLTTDPFFGRSSKWTQTWDTRQPPKKKTSLSAFTNYISDHFHDVDFNISDINEILTPTVFNININQNCSHVETECLSDDSLDADDQRTLTTKINTTPDLLSNHNPTESDVMQNNISTVSKTPVEKRPTIEQQKILALNISVSGSNCVEKEENCVNAECRTSLSSAEGNRNAPLLSRNKKAPCDSNIGSGAAVNINQTADRVPEDEAVLDARPSVPSPGFSNHNNLLSDASQDNRLHTPEFSDDELIDIPKKTVDTLRTETSNNILGQMEDLIMGANRERYPYNIVISPLKNNTNFQKNTKKVSFKDIQETMSKEPLKRRNIDHNQFRNHNPSNIERNNQRTTVSKESRPLEKIESDEYKSESLDEIDFSDSESSNDSKRSNRYCQSNKQSISISSGIRFGDKSKGLPLQTDFKLKDGNKLLSSTYSPVYLRTECVSPYATRDNETKVSTPNLNAKPSRFVDSKTRVSVSTGRQKDEALLELEKEILSCCSRLELYTDQHMKYLHNIDERRRFWSSRRSPTSFAHSPTLDSSARRSPSKYLKHLLDIRKDVVNLTRNDNI